MRTSFTKPRLCISHSVNPFGSYPLLELFGSTSRCPARFCFHLAFAPSHLGYSCAQSRFDFSLPLLPLTSCGRLASLSAENFSLFVVDPLQTIASPATSGTPLTKNISLEFYSPIFPPQLLRFLCGSCHAPRPHSLSLSCRQPISPGLTAVFDTCPQGWVPTMPLCSRWFFCSQSVFEQSPVQKGVAFMRHIHLCSPISPPQLACEWLS